MARRRETPPDDLPPDEQETARYDAVPEPRATRPYPAVGEDAYEEEVMPRPRPPWWRENLWVWLLLLLVLVIGGIVALLLLQRDDDESANRATVPAVVGLREPEAVERLAHAGFDVREERVENERPEGIVIAQTPGGGTQLEKGQTVVISVSTGPPDVVTVTQTTTTTPAQPPPPPATVAVQDVVGLNQVDAGDVFEGDGLVADSYPVPSGEPAGTVVSQNPAPGTKLMEGETVRLNVSLGPGPREAAEIPDLTGPRATVARRKARVAGFTVRTLLVKAPSAEEIGEVVDQRPAAGTTAPILTQITIFVGRR